MFGTGIALYISIRHKAIKAELGGKVMEELEMAIMNIIINAGDCKNHCYMALGMVNEGKYDEAEEEIKLANDALAKAHDSQTAMIQKEASGDKIELSLLFVHAQDHLMTAISEKNLIEQIMELRKVVNTLIK